MILVQRKQLKYPINDVYPAIYRDEHGEEMTAIRNDGQQLEMTVRGVRFVGGALNDFRPVEEIDSEALSFFVLNWYQQNLLQLCDCEIELEIPIPIVANGRADESVLHLHVYLGSPGGSGWLYHEDFNFTLYWNNQEFHAPDEWFEDGLLKIQDLLPESVYMKACINCAYSDYSPYGHSTFGDMQCFRDNKEKYAQAHAKDE